MSDVPNENKPVKRGPGNPAWKKGVSGNPGGRSKAIERVRLLAREKAPRVIEALDTIVHNEEEPGRTRVAAAHELLEHGIPPLPPEVNVEGESLVIVVKTVTGGSPWGGAEPYRVVMAHEPAMLPAEGDKGGA